MMHSLTSTASAMRQGAQYLGIAYRDGLLRLSMLNSTVQAINALALNALLMQGRRHLEILLQLAN